MQYAIHTATGATTGPTEEPVAVAELRQQCSIGHTSDDLWLYRMGVAARELVELETERSLLTATYTLTLDAFPDVIEIRKAPLASVTSVAYIDTAGASQSLTEGTHFDVDTSSAMGRITPTYATSWPSTRATPNAVTVVYVAGDTAPENVQERAKHAIATLVSHWYNSREAGLPVAVTEVPLLYQALIDSLKWRQGM